MHHRVDGLPDQPHDPRQSPHDCRKSDDRQLLYRKQRCQSFARHGQAAYSFEQDGITQTLHIHLEEYGPGGKSQKHGHVNEAAFYILDGRGYEIHDGVRYDWSAGDVAVVHNNCVHQHFNADPDKPARALVLKAKPMYMFMNMLFQQLVEPRPTEPAPGGANFSAREAEDDHNHAK